MARKTKEEAQETYTALLDAAENVFREKGVTNTTLTDVAVAAGMTRGAIYWHFKDKIDLFKAMCDRAFMPMEALLNEVAAGPGNDPLQSLRQMALHMLNLVATDTRQRAVFDILFHHCEKNSALEFFVQDQEKRAECLDRVTLIFQAAVNQGQLPPDTDIWLAMHAHHAYLMGLISQWLESPEDYDLALHAETMVDIFLAGLKAKPPLKRSTEN
ncbi:TetR family transcriptional regulator [Undibacterium terreum]|uniref:TetR family transcriptional regulator n=1 Tax=Undibacterium terreum TaxID=1224302 RepID=A0A916UCZ9_9BURK|nr:TetR family transcriptional regulator [Undibacterium terreum]GGC68931.1 TetR family transcriptional regulator [Undibacterium terreum]